ncbi:large ribosomal subunit protein uL6m [Monosporozyma unispora]
MLSMKLLTSKVATQSLSRRTLSSSAILRSHVGGSGIFTTPETQVKIEPLDPPTLIQKGIKRLVLNQLVTVTGPKGEVTMEVPNFANIKIDEEHRRINVSVLDTEKKLQKSMWGTIRSHIQNHVIGVNEGHLAVLKFIGTGYRAQLENDGKYIGVKVGASIPQGLYVPEGITATLPAPTTLILEGCNKQQVMLLAAKIRNFHPPEPYKGKGIYVNNEKIKLKNKKIK